ncbi:MAG: alpha/beta fold hydrolase [Agathobacter sp.]|nr:alpha/beta fold hydrolase [Agathobacter sp.]
MGTEKKKLTKIEKRVLVVMVIVAIVAAVTFAVLMYINDYYKATEKAQTAILGNSLVEVTETGDYYFFDSPGDIQSGKGIIFYPGGKVDEVAYAPLLLDLAEQGYDVYLVKMPAKLAIFGMNAAEGIMKEATDITEWTMMGHSLGGAMAASFSASHDEEVGNLVLLAAYSMEDLTKLDMDVYSFYGSEDKVLNMEKYQEYYTNLPADMVETVIDGGNHAYFGNYGEQDGDGTATIARDEQQATVLDVFVSLEKDEMLAE